MEFIGREKWRLIIQSYFKRTVTGCCGDVGVRCVLNPG